MNKTLNDIGKKLPYSENNEYLDSLIDRVTENAIKRHPQLERKRRWRMMASAVAAVAMVLVVVGVTLFNAPMRSNDALQPTGPIDEFLNSLTDEEVAALPYYEIEEIPEY